MNTNDIDMIYTAVDKAIKRKTTTSSLRSKRSKVSDNMEISNISVVSEASVHSRSSRKRTPRKRDTKDNNNRDSPRNNPRSNKSTPMKIGNKSIPVFDAIVEDNSNEISDSERERLESEVLLSKSALSHPSETSVPVNFTNGPVTRAKTKDYVFKRHVEETEEKPRINLIGEIHEPDRSPSPDNNRSFFNSPLRQRLLTPMRAFASGIRDSVKRINLLSKQRRSKIDYEVLNNAF